MSYRMSYRKYTVLLVLTSIMLAAGLALSVELAAAAAPQGRSLRASYSDNAGTLAYEVYVPSTYDPNTAVPMVVALHGCSENAQKFRELTRFDQLAEAKKMIVVFPEQNSNSNSQNCWNWFKNEHMQRGAGEPSLLAGITQRVAGQYNVDPHRIYAAGLSAGGAMASVMSATYPDLFAAVGVGSGCEYAATAACAGYKGLDPEQAGKQAYDAMGSHKRVVPVIVFQGDQDTTVPPANGQQLVQQWQVTDDLIDNGARDHSVPDAPTSKVDGAVPGGRSYTVSHYSDGHGGEAIQYWLVKGMPHAWSGGCSCQPFSDPTGPDETAAMYDFFMSHPAP